MTTREPYPAVVQGLMDTARLPELGLGRPNDKVRKELAALTLEELFAGRKIVDRDAAACCLAGLWLLHDFLDQSHSLSQQIESIDGSYWHGIMHRREPDYSNAKYWFRRVPSHPVFMPLGDAARQLAQGHQVDPPADFLKTRTAWDPFRFIDLCEAIARGKSSCERLARQIARAEWDLLFEHCYGKAVGSAA
jgi:hypothetical protein